jgi:hypothetical protein
MKVHILVDNIACTCELILHTEVRWYFVKLQISRIVLILDLSELVLLIVRLVLKNIEESLRVLY